MIIERCLSSMILFTLCKVMLTLGVCVHCKHSNKRSHSKGQLSWKADTKFGQFDFSGDAPTPAVMSAKLIQYFHVSAPAKAWWKRGLTTQVDII